MIQESNILTESVEHSKLHTRFYPENWQPTRIKNPRKQMRVSVTGNRTFQAARIIARRNPGKRIAVLNFASATGPGGGVTRGSAAQEESLCRCSTLYPVLKSDQLWKKYYSVNRNRSDSRYTDACIYTPYINVIKSDEDHPERLPESEWLRVDVITCAAPNFRHGAPADEEVEKIHISRGRRILDVALDNNADCLVLGAYGCGAFRNDPAIVSRVYAQLMEEYRGVFDEIEFAVFHCGKEVENFNAFKEAMSQWES